LFSPSLYSPLLLQRSKVIPIRRASKVPLIFFVLPLFVVAHLSHHLISALVTPLLPLIRDAFSLDYTKAGVLVSAFNLIYGVSQLPTGWLADRFGFRTMIAVGISGVALCGLLIGLSSGFVMMSAFLVLMGVMGGGYHPSASPLISSAVPEKYRGRALGIHQIGGTASFFLAPLIAVAIANRFGWRGSFLALSVPVMLYGVALLLLLLGWGFGGPVATRSKTADTSTVAGADAGEDGNVRKLVPVIALNALLQIFVYTVINFIPLYVVDHFKGSKESAALFLSLAHSAGIWGGPLGGLLSDRVGRIPVLIFTGALAGPLIYLLNQASPGVPLAVILIFLGMTMYMSMPVTESFVISHAPKGRRSTFLGVYYSVSRGGPGLMAPALGYMIDRYTFGAAFIVVSLAMAMSAIICSSLIARGKKPQNKS
jgi:FSR family fosmidomycin resistance protein-like MFS transporter